MMGRVRRSCSVETLALLKPSFFTPLAAVIDRRFSLEANRRRRSQTVATAGLQQSMKPSLFSPVAAVYDRRFSLKAKLMAAVIDRRYSRSSTEHGALIGK
jgi:hypothetical protein